MRLADLGVALETGARLCSHRGNPALRALIAGDYQVAAEDVLIAPGAAAALFIVNTALLDANGNCWCAANYATNLEVPRTLRSGCTFSICASRTGTGSTGGDGCAHHAGTKLISVTYPHNPTGW